MCCFSSLGFNLLVVLKVRSTVFSWSSERLRKIDSELKGNLHLCKDVLKEYDSFYKVNACAVSRIKF